MSFEIAVSLGLLGSTFLLFFLASFLRNKEEMPLRVLLILAGVYLLILNTQTLGMMVDISTPSSNNQTYLDVKNNLVTATQAFTLLSYAVLFFFVMLFVIYYLVMIGRLKMPGQKKLDKPKELETED